MSEEWTPGDNPLHAPNPADGDDPMEARLRRALTARADLVTNRDLVQWSMPEPTPPNRTPWFVAAASVAAAVLAAVALSLSGWNPFGSGTTSVPVAQGGGPSSSAAAGTPPASSAASSATPTPADGATPGQTEGATAGSTPGTTAGPAASPSSTVAVCTPAVVSAFVLPDTDSRPHGGGMNHQGATIGITNVGSSPCRLYGYLGVGLYNGDSLESTETTLRGNTGYAQDPGPTSIVLAPGSSAYTELGWSSADGTKPATEVTQVRVILPDQKQQLTIAFTSVIGGAARELFQTALTPAPLPLNG